MERQPLLALLMGFFVKLALANAVIVAAAQLGRRHPPLAGLIATMPLTTLVVMVWLYSDAPTDRGRLVAYTRAVLWGIVPSIAFFGFALFCLQKRVPFPAAMAAGFGAWLAGAALHRWLLV